MRNLNGLLALRNTLIPSEVVKLCQWGGSSRVDVQNLLRGGNFKFSISLGMYYFWQSSVLLVLGLSSTGSLTRYPSSLQGSWAK